MFTLKPESPASRGLDSSFYLKAALLGLFTILLLRTAWMCDDAYITLRTVDNFVEGYGLRWNVAERVQAFTHPLWLLLLSVPYYFTREGYLTPLAVSVLLSLSAVWIFVRYIARSIGTCTTPPRRSLQPYCASRVSSYARNAPSSARLRSNDVPYFST